VLRGRGKAIWRATKHQKVTRQQITCSGEVPRAKKIDINTHALIVSSSNTREGRARACPPHVAEDCYCAHYETSQPGLPQAKPNKKNKGDDPVRIILPEQYAAETFLRIVLQ